MTMRSDLAKTIPGIIERLRSHVDCMPDKLFMSVEIAGRERRLNFADAWQDFLACASIVAQAGCQPDAVVLLFLPQGWDAIAFFFGAMLAGCVPSFMPNPSPKQDADTYWASHRMLLDRIRPAAIVTNGPQAAAMAANGLLVGERRLILASTPRPVGRGVEIDDNDPDRIALLQHSSGTTGSKKGVMISHRAVLRQVSSYADAIRATERDVIVSWLPLYHDMGLVACLLMPAILGQTVIMLDPFEWVGRPVSLFQAITRYNGTLCWLPNFAFEHLARTVRPDGSLALGTMRAFINCSEPCQVTSFRRFAQAFAGIGARPEMLQVCYAMAETTFAATQHPLPEPNRVLMLHERALVEHGRAAPPAPGDAVIELLSAGPPIRDMEVVIRDMQKRDLPAGEVGEICLRAPFLFDGYFRLPEQTAERLVDGWYHTRDRGFILEGEVYVLGRMDDLLILNGRNFHAAEIEALINDVAGLKPGRNVAFGQFSPARGTNELIVVAERAADAAPEDAGSIRQQVRQALFEGLGLYPSGVMLVPQGWLVKTSSGKIARGANVDKYQHARGLAKEHAG